MLVEGVGGFLVPLGPRYDAADLAQDLALPVILVVGMRLGCINHALLTRDAIAARGLPLAGWVANRIDPQMNRFEENLEALKARLPAPLLGIVPANSTPADAARGLSHLRALRWPTGAKPERLQARAWVEDGEGRILALAGNRCP